MDHQIANIAGSAITRRDALRVLSAGCVGLAQSAPSSAGQVQRELLIRRGRVVNADGARDADVRVVGTTIQEIGPNLQPHEGARVIDASDRLVLPGGIDPHTHLSPSFVDDFTSGSMAALAGGITALGTFAAAQAGESLSVALDRMSQRVRAEAIADVFLHFSAWPPTPEILASMKTIADLGMPSFKIFMMRPDFASRIPDVIEQLQAARDAGVVTMIHCEDSALLAAAVRQLEAERRTTLRDYAESRPVVAEVAATEAAAALCESTRAPMYVVHVSASRALDACRRARTNGARLFVETRPPYLHITIDRLRGADAPLYVGQPPLREAADQEALWRGLEDGSIDVLATDHAPWTREQKLDPSLSITRLRPGMSDLQFMLPMYFSEGVRRRHLSLERFVATTSTNAARIFGLYPRKGAIREGSDADIVIWDQNRTATVRASDDLSKADYSVYEGWKVTGWPATTIRRGEIVYESGRMTARAGTGLLLQRDRWRG